MGEGGGVGVTEGETQANPISVYIFNGKIYSLCQSNSIYKFFPQKFSLKYYIGLLFS